MSLPLFIEAVNKSAADKTADELVHFVLSNMGIFDQQGLFDSFSLSSTNRLQQVLHRACGDLLLLDGMSKIHPAYKDRGFPELLHSKMRAMYAIIGHFDTDVNFTFRRGYHLLVTIDDGNYPVAKHSYGPADFTPTTVVVDYRWVLDSGTSYKRTLRKYGMEDNLYREACLFVARGWPKLLRYELDGFDEAKTDEEEQDAGEALLTTLCDVFTNIQPALFRSLEFTHTVLEALVRCLEAGSLHSVRVLMRKFAESKHVPPLGAVKIEFDTSRLNERQNKMFWFDEETDNNHFWWALALLHQINIPTALRFYSQYVDGQRVMEQIYQAAVSRDFYRPVAGMLRMRPIQDFRDLDFELDRLIMQTELEWEALRYFAFGPDWTGWSKLVFEPLMEQWVKHSRWQVRFFPPWIRGFLWKLFAGTEDSMTDIGAFGNHNICKVMLGVTHVGSPRDLEEISFPRNLLNPIAEELSDTAFYDEEHVNFM